MPPKGVTEPREFREGKLRDKPGGGMGIPEGFHWVQSLFIMTPPREPP